MHLMMNAITDCMIPPKWIISFNSAWMRYFASDGINYRELLIPLDVCPFRKFAVFLPAAVGRRYPHEVSAFRTGVVMKV